MSHASADEIEVIAGRERENLEGWIPALASEAEVREALEKAFDYRGDITMTRKDGSRVEGYLYDRRQGTTLARLRLCGLSRPRAARTKREHPVLAMWRRWSSPDAIRRRARRLRPG